MFSDGGVSREWCSLETLSNGVVIRQAFRQVLRLTNVEAACGVALQDVKEIHGSELVEPMGFEPTTSSMPSRRAPSCATAPPKYANILAHVGEEGGVKPPLRVTRKIWAIRCMTTRRRPPQKAATTGC